MNDMNKLNFKRGLTRRAMTEGFTLIELLIVVAIIALLAGVVLASLNNARLKGGDAGVKSNLHTLTNQAEIFFSNNGNSYLPAGGTAIGITTPCPAYDSSGNGSNMFSNNKVLADALAQALSSGSGSSCYNSSAVWAAAVGLKTNAGASWCVDSSGASKQVASAPASAINAGTFLCN